MKHFNFNGKLVKEDTKVVSAGNRGLRYGDGLFETMRYKGERLILADEHFARLWKGMKTLHFQVPNHFSPERLHDEIAALATKNGHSKNARVRLNVFRGNGGLYDAVNHIPNYLIETWDLSDGNDQWNSNGLVTGIYEEAKKSIDILSNLKHNNYLPYVMAALHAKENKWNDAIILNSQGRICDSTIANIFIIKNEVLYTPALSEGCVAGVIRNYLLRQSADFDFKVFEQGLSVEDVLNADEVFLTNSIYYMRWVQCIADRSYGNAIAQKIYHSIIPTIS